MDPVTHTLFGATLAQTGLRDRTRLGAATLLIGANLPDVDVLSYVWSPIDALWLRRGVTHGALALLVLPFVLTALVICWDRLARTWRKPDCVARPTAVLALSALAIASHPVLDTLNTYGMRWLMPVSSRWIYGDTLFIVDPWTWIILTAGVLLAARRRRAAQTTIPTPPVRWSGRPAVLCLILFGAYVGVMALSTLVGRGIVLRATRRVGGTPPERMMVAPLPITPLERRVVLDDGETYRFGTLRWLPRPRFDLDTLILPRMPPHYAATVATRGPAVRKYLSWARFPYYLVEDLGDRYVVRIADARYTLEPEGSWAGMAVDVAK